jgi:hypothetical protein
VIFSFCYAISSIYGSQLIAELFGCGGQASDALLAIAGFVGLCTSSVKTYRVRHGTQTQVLRFPKATALEWGTLILLLAEEGRFMTKRSLLVNTILSAALFCTGVTLAQEPVMDIDKSVHPNLAEAQHHVVEANNWIAVAQKDNKYDMHGHAEKARQLLVQVNQELKLAAEAANAANQKKK